MPKKYLGADGIGKLKELISAAFVGKNQGAAQAGKVLGINDDGIVVPVADDGGDAFVPYNINLLDNSDWGYNLVNQRGSASYSISTGTWDSSIGGDYTIDRWITHGNITIVSPTASAVGYVTMASGAIMKQRMEIMPTALLGKTCCIAVDIGGIVYSGTVQFPSAASGASAAVTLGGISAVVGFDGGTYTLCGISNVSGVPYIKLTAGAAVNVRRVWLELGEVCHMETTPPKNYAESLLRCMRYFNKISVGGGVIAAVGLYITTTTARVPLPIQVTMRIKPQIIKAETSKFLVRGDGTALEPTAIEIFGNSNEKYVTFSLTVGSTVSTNVPAALVGNATMGATADISISADL